MKIEYIDYSIIFALQDIHDEADLSILTGAINAYCKLYCDSANYNENDINEILAQFKSQYGEQTNCRVAIKAEQFPQTETFTPDMYERSDGIYCYQIDGIKTGIRLAT